jgi:hypothetical protein
MDHYIPSRLFSDKLYYSAHFMDLALWEDSVRMVCARHGFRYKEISPALPGSFPTFIVQLDVDDALPDSRTIVVKFFGPLFDGAASFAIERVMGHYLAQQPLPIRSPAILAEGQLDPQWQYLIFEGVSGVSIGQVRQQLTEVSMVRAAGQLGAFIKRLHTLTATTPPLIPMATDVMSWEGFLTFLDMQRVNCRANHQQWKDFPAQLLGQVQDYLLPVEELLDLTSAPHLIHADLTGDHLLGRLTRSKETPTIRARSLHIEGVDWDSLAIIDWGDARVGNILYELVALHLDLFKADKHLLHICLEHYGLPDFYQQDFTHKALCMLLLYQFPMPASVFAPHKDAQNLHELAERLFGA